MSFDDFVHESYLSGGRAPLYHATSLHGAIRTLKYDLLQGQEGDVSFSRSGDFVYDNRPVVLEFDYDALANNHHIHPVDFFSTGRSKSMTNRGANFEYEERVPGTIKDVHKYLTAILIRPEVSKELETGLMLVIEEYVKKYPEVKVKEFDKRPQDAKVLEPQ